MLPDDSCWRLSPVYDLVPNIGFNSEHVLCIGYDNKIPDIETFLNEAKCFGIKRKYKALDVIKEVCEVVVGWGDDFMRNT